MSKRTYSEHNTKTNGKRRGAALLALCLVLMLAMMLAGCGGTDADASGSAGAISASTDAGEGSGDNGNADGASGDSEEGSMEDAIEGIPLKTWQDSYILSERDDKPYPVKVRFTSVDTDPDKVKKQIEEFNVSAAGYTIPSMDSSATYSYAIAHYEVAFPEDYPDGDYGITNVAPKFSIRAADGGDVITVGNVNHEGLTETFEIGSLPQGYDFHAGDTYKGAIVYIMVTGFEDYRILEEVPADDAKDAQHYYMPH